MYGKLTQNPAIQNPAHKNLEKIQPTIFRLKKSRMPKSRVPKSGGFELVS